jgi:death-on-curing protein
MTLWLSKRLVLAMHDEQLREHGGASGLRDEGLLESALARPVNRAGYGDPDIVELAALYADAIAHNHPFIDGNKRTAFTALVVFLDMNGMEFDPPEAEAVVMMLALASSEIDEAAFTAWVRQYATEPPATA